MMRKGINRIGISKHDRKQDLGRRWRRTDRVNGWADRRTLKGLGRFRARACSNETRYATITIPPNLVV